MSILLDVDRDYATYYRLEIDQRGCVCEDCWGDKTWNPRWFVAIHSEPGVWEAEAAIPLSELTGDPISLGRTWACNVVRVTPGQGVQAFSLPADVLPRPEGMGLLMFALRGAYRAAVEDLRDAPGDDDARLRVRVLSQERTFPQDTNAKPQTAHYAASRGCSADCTG